MQVSGKKQYVLKRGVYPDNDEVVLYVNGKFEGSSIMNFWETEGYCRAIEEQGYTCAYDLKALKAELDVLEAEYTDMKKYYESVKDEALIGTRVVEKPELYWVSYIIHPEGCAPTLCATTTGQDTFEQAKEIIDRGRKQFNVLAAWIDVFDDKEQKHTIFHECYLK